jgi:hypothetical protein
MIGIYTVLGDSSILSDSQKIINYKILGTIRQKQNI